MGGPILSTISPAAGSHLPLGSTWKEPLKPMGTIATPAEVLIDHADARPDGVAGGAEHAGFAVHQNFSRVRVLYFGTLSYYDSARMYDPKRFITVMLEFEALTAYYATCPYRRTVLYYGILADYNIFFNSNSLAYNDIVSVLDIGSDAGLPGIIIAICRPDLDVHVAEPMQRRCEWLFDVVEHLDFDNVTIQSFFVCLSGCLSI